MTDKKETTVVTSGSGGSGWYVAIVVLIVAAAGGLYLFQYGGLSGGSKTVNVDVKLPDPAPATE